MENQPHWATLIHQTDATGNLCARCGSPLPEPGDWKRNANLAVNVTIGLREIVDDDGATYLISQGAEYCAPKGD